jgi:hypothetical protein
LLSDGDTLDLVPRSVSLLVRLSTVLDNTATAATEEVGALKPGLAWLLAAIIVGKAQVHARHVDGYRAERLM